MKKTKHITVNFNDNEYKKIEILSNKEKRKKADYIYLLVIKELERIK